jgi:hypothetical protein
MTALRRQLKLLAAPARLIILAGLAYGLASANPLAPPQRTATRAGNYTISGVHYMLDSADPGNLARLAFQVAPNPGAGATVRARLVSSSDVFFSCSNIPAGSPAWECPLRGVPVRAADLLTVEIGDQPAPAKNAVYFPMLGRGARHALLLPMVKR